MIRRGEVRWAELAEPRGSEPGHRRPVLVVQADAFNRSRIATVMVVTLTSNDRLADAPGNVPLPASATGLPRDSVANVSQLLTLHRSFVGDPGVLLPGSLLEAVDAGLRLSLFL